MESTKPKGENFTYIDLDAVNNKKNNIDNPKILKSINAPSRASRKLHTNDVLYSMVRPYLRNIALVDKKFSNAIASTGFYVITPSIALHPHFLFHLMLSSYVTDGLNLFMKGENSPSINNSHIEDFLYPLPPLAEQQRIVEKIEGLIPHIEHYGKAQTELDLLNRSIKEQLKKSVLQYAIEGELVPQDETEGTAEELLLQIQAEKLKLYEENKLKKKDLEHSTIFKDEDNKYYEKIGKNVTCIDEEIPFDIPKNWRWVRFGQIVKLSMGKTPPRDDSRYWLNAKRNWVSISDMTNYGRIKTTKEQISEEAANSLMRESSPINTLLMSFKLTVGRTAILDIEAYHNEAIVSIYPYIDKKFMLRNYLFYTLPILANIGDSKDAIKGKTLNSKSLNNLLIPLPPLAEQLRIIESIDTIFRCIEKD